MSESTTERLARALEHVGAPADMILKARRGEYDDYKSPHATPVMNLVADASAAGLPDIADRAKAGEFDSTREEGETWAKSPEGRETIRRLRG